MPYVTTQLQPSYRQITLEDMLDGNLDPDLFKPIRNAPSSTRTFFRERLPREFVNRFNIPGMIRVLREFTEKYAALYEVPRAELYHHFEIPKSTGGYRPIDAPDVPLKMALYELKHILESTCGAMYHTTAFAYVPNRCTVDALRRHQANQSKWFLKTDFHNFFGSTTPEFVKQMLMMIFPFSEIYKSQEGERVLDRALDLCFLNGGLPQGTPISPMLTNLMMIPIDHTVSNELRDRNGIHYVYTRYADDMLISSKVNFQWTGIVQYINEVLERFQAPFRLHPDKTRYGSANGHNFNLGLILNDKNEITIGYKKKWAFRGQLFEYIQRHLRQETISLREVQQMSGVLSYYRSIEPEFWRNVIRRLNEKCKVDLDKMIDADLKSLVLEVC